MSRRQTAPTRLRGAMLAVAAAAMALMSAAALTADGGSRAHATGQFDSATSTYIPSPSAMAYPRSRSASA